MGSRRPPFPAALVVGPLLLACALAGGCGSGPRAPAPPRNVLLVVVDTLGARSVSLDDERVDFTPRLEALRGRHTFVFRQAFSPAPWTKPALASMLTGLYPSEHGLKDMPDLFRPPVPTLAERFHEKGYATKGIVSHLLLNRGVGFERGFDEYDNVNRDLYPHEAITSPAVTDAAVAWLRGRAQAGAQAPPFFLFVHYFDPHYSYHHHEEYDRSSWYRGEITPETDFEALLDRAHAGDLHDDDFRYLQSLYQEEVAYTDEHIGQLLAALGELGLADDTLVVFSADHGEEFGDHGSIGHTKTLYDELIEVPLVVSFPGPPQVETCDTVVSTIDVTPTLLDLYGLHPPERVSGRSLVPLLADPTARLDRLGVFAEVSYTAEKRRARKVARIELRKLVYDQEHDRYELYDLRADPLEREDLYGTAGADAGRMLRALELFQRTIQGVQTAGGGKIEFSELQLEQLRRLGYL